MRHHLGLLLLGAVAGLGLACAGNTAEPPAPPPPTAVTGQTASPPPPSATPAPAPSPAAANNEAVRFQTDDGVTVVGHLYSTPGPQRRIVILAHEADKDQRAWQGLASELAAQGIAALTFDFRGHGETGGVRDPARADRELTTALLFVRSRDYPLIYVLAAGANGAAALNVAARQELAGVIAVSVPPQVTGFDWRQDVAAVSEPKLFLGSAGGQPPVDATTDLMTAAREPKQSQLFEGSARGSELLSGPHAVAFKNAILAFLTR